MTVWAWGSNNYGQLGDGTTTTRITPVQVSGLTGVTSIVAGSLHSLALKTDGTVWAWGSNLYGQLGQNHTIQSLVPIESRIYTAGSLSFTNTSYMMNIPLTGTSTITVAAQGTDSYGNAINPSSITYSLAGTYTGVSINSTTGVVTVSSTAAAGTVKFMATYQNLICNATLTLSSASPNLNISITSDNTYDITFSLNNVTSFSGGTYTLTYDSTALQLTDLSALTSPKETTASTISGAGVTVTSVSAGQIVFTVNRTIPVGSKWSGVVNVFEFKALKTGSTTISIL